MIQHIVILKFHPSTTVEQIDQAIARARTLNKEIDGILDIKAGHNFSERNQGYSMGLTVTFTDKESLEKYGPHPKHQELVSYLKEIGLADTLVIDFEV